MITDRELLELAAKTVGVNGQYFWNIDDAGIETEGGRVWNPLSDDGDALRLAVTLRFRVSTPTAGVRYGERAVAESQDRPHGVFSNCGDEALDKADPLAATRRAIVRAAAEIGKTMPS
ncbi:hypothetical protein [Bradyrhizobium sp. cf659]|uniref:hypothetical protein n=1 Tax=Bradyrhizobium sp. cf659 TaxID=1761771 RepID=UPI0008E076D0|nr:hypothetical protein [Bradyrhizobium sp. cf659]SFJ85315.1 hypothetical protein SAMN04487925_112111 [Bradyrhizobium sp. cf659]